MTDMPLQPASLEIPERPFGRVVRSVFGYALLMAFMFFPPVIVFMPAAIFHCGIRNGRRATWLALTIGSIIGIALGVLTAHQPGATIGEIRLTYAYLASTLFALALPAMLALPLIERSASFGKVLVTAMLIIIPGLAATEFGARTFLGVSPYADQLAQTAQFKGEVLAYYQRTPGFPPEAVDAARRGLDMASKVVACGPVIMFSVFFLLSILMFGRLRAWREFVRTREVSQLSTVYLFRNFSLPEWLLFAFVISGLAPLATGLLQKVAANVLVVVLFLYLLQGLAIFRSLLVAVGINGIGLLFAFVLLGFLTLTGIAPILLTIAGLFDSFFDFRKFKRKDDSNESHTD
ncbi:MAG TPA: DUF2232 domain-containing protein [Thermoanaerobaculia bacterium]|nr:DUF2232 domain-containing protein [Thermoanaerobaculia bacterium]